MAKCEPFHSKLDTEVYHDNDSCTVGDNIETYNKEAGTGRKRRGAQCTNLS